MMSLGFIEIFRLDIYWDQNKNQVDMIHQGAK